MNSQTTRWNKSTHARFAMAKLWRYCFLIAVTLQALLASPSAQAASQWWDTGSGTWNTPAGNNVWSTSSVSGTGDTNFTAGNDVTFSSNNFATISGPITITTSAISANSITFTGTTSYNFTNGGTLTLGNATGNTAITMNSGSGAVTFAGQVTTAGSTGTTTTFTNNSTSLLTFGGIVTSSGAAAGVTQSIAINGSGSGGVTFNGVLQGNNAAFSNEGGTVNLSISGGGTVTLNAANVIVGTTTLSTGGSLVLGNTKALQGQTLNYTGGTLSFGNLTSAQIAGLTGSANITLANASSQAVNLILAAFAIGNAQAGGANPTYTGALSGAGGVT